MNNVTIVKGDLFSAPKGSIICHAVNCKGVWGAGIANQFRKRYPDAYKTYEKICKEQRSNDLLGSCLLIETNDFIIGCLFTSSGYGYEVDDKDSILDATYSAIDDLLDQNVMDPKEIHMCKINSGLFGVPWPETQQVLESFEEKFTVYEL